MKILHIIPSFEVAGAETMAQDLMLAQKALGHDVSAISLFDCDTPITKKLRENEITIYFLHKKRGCDLFTVKRIREYLKTLKPDVTHTHLDAVYSFMAAIGFYNITMIHTVHNVAQIEATLLKQYILRPIYKSKKIIPVALTPEIQKTICNLYWLNAKDVPVIFNGRDLRLFISRQIKRPENIKRFIHVARYVPQKNQISLIEAFFILHRKYPDVSLDLIGDGELYGTIRQKIAQYGLEDCVRQLGRKQNVADYLAEADAFVLPSIFEGMPISLIEALACGLPCIVTPVGGVPDIIKDNDNGIFCNTSATSIAEAMEKLICDSELCQKLSTKARSTAIKFSATKMAHDYIELYSKEISRRL